MPDEGTESESSGSIARTSDSSASRNTIGSPRFHRQRGTCADAPVLLLWTPCAKHARTACLCAPGACNAARPQERPSMDVAPTDVVV